MPKRDAAVDPAVAEWTKDWQRLRQQKWRMSGGVEARMITSLCMYFGEQYVQQARGDILQRGLIKDEDLNKLNLVFNFTKKAAKRKIGRLWSAPNRFTASPDKPDPQAFDQAEIVGTLIKALGKKLKERRQHWLRLWWLVTTGVVCEHVPWIEDDTVEAMPAYDPESGQLLWRDNANPDPEVFLMQAEVEARVIAGETPERFSVIETIQTAGDVGSQILSPFNYFQDASVPTIDALGADQAAYIVEVKTVAWVRDQFGSDVADQISGTAGSDLGIVQSKMRDRGNPVASMNLRDLLPAVQGSRGTDDPEMCLFATRYQPAGRQNPRGLRSMFVPGGPLCYREANPYGEVPIVDFHYEAQATSFWTSDFITPMIPGQKFTNKRFSQMGEAANASIYEVLLLGGGLTKADITSDMPSQIENGLSEDGMPYAVPLQRGQLPPWFIESLKLVIEMTQSLGQSDLLNHAQQFSQMRGPMAIPMIQEMLDSEDGPLYEHLGEQLATVHQQRVNRVQQYYPGIRTLHYTGTGKRDAVLVFNTEQVLRAGTNFNITVDPGSLLPEFSALREARMIERLQGPLAGLYTNKRTGRIDFTKIAMDLKFEDETQEDRLTQYRELERHLIKRLWQGEVLPEEIPYPFWDHDVCLDELEAAMATTEFLEASTPVKQAFMAIYERHRQYLAAIQDAQMNATQNQMVQGTMAQAAQQAAAKAAATATDIALQQVHAQQQLAQQQPPMQSVQQALLANKRGGQGRLN